MQLLNASSFRRNDIFDDHLGELGQPRYQIKKEELQQPFDIYHSWTKVALKLDVSEESFLKGLTQL